ncbi:GIY-YIG nuclease family protein [Alteromonas sp. CYL-A6]|uniref:GIY-YIG nuclease family protein n=1 Tax=Alteromonas nitratireducens TaxID=3390813 RepID=UPI0034B7246F
MNNRQLRKVYNSVSEPAVDFPMFMQRVARLCVRGELTEKNTQHAATLDLMQYKRIFSVRRTIATLNGRDTVINDLYSSIERPRVPYSVFRARLLTISQRQRKWSISPISDVHLWAAEWMQSDWAKLIGPRESYFDYNGKEFSLLRGKRFLSLWHLLKTIGKEDLRALVRSRLKYRWDIDKAISDPKCHSEKNGIVYSVYSENSGKEYIGITIVTSKERWTQHVHAAAKSESRALAREITRYGEEAFNFQIICCSLSGEDLGWLERRLIKQRNTRWPNGLNMTPGGEHSRGAGKAIKIAGIKFKSVTDAGQWVCEQTKGRVASYVAESRIRKLLTSFPQISKRHLNSLFKPSRKHSKHPKAGTYIWRKWLQFYRRKQLCEKWRDFDEFERDVMNNLTTDDIKRRKLALCRVDHSQPFSPQNFIWMFSRKVK